MIDNINEKESKLLTAIMYSILFANDMSLCYMFDTLNIIEQSVYYKHNIKHKVGTIRKQMRLYNRELTIRSQKIEYIADVNELFYEKIKDDIFKLENVTYNYITRCHIHNPKLMAKMAVCDILTQTACVNLDVCCSSKDVKHLTNAFKFLRLTNIAKTFKDIYKRIDDINSTKSDFLCDLNQPQSIKDGFNVIVKKIQDFELIFKIINSLEQNENEN